MHRQSRRIKSLGLVAALTVSSLVAPTSLTAGAAPERAASPWRASIALAALGSIRDTATSRTSIYISDLDAIWRSAGVPVPPSVLPKNPRALKRVLKAFEQMFGGSPVGARLWLTYFIAGAPLGYPVMALHGDLEIGPPGNELSEIWGPISEPAVVKVLTRIKPHTTTEGPNLLIDLGSRPSHRPPTSFKSILTDIRYLALPRTGGRLVAGDLRASSSAVTDLTGRAKVPNPLSSDPAVAAIASAVGPTFQSLAMGTEFVTKVAGLLKELRPRPALWAKVESASGLSRLRAGPVMVGWAYTKGTPEAESVVAAAFYPTPTDARTAATTVARYTATGTSLRLDEPYRKLWQVDATTVHGNLVVMDLTIKSPDAIIQALVTDDFPLFWSP
jgi:hypothetical protein